MGNKEFASFTSITYGDYGEIRMGKNRPNNIAVMIIKGHQYDHTIKLDKFVLRSIFAKSGSLVVTPIAPYISKINTANVINCRLAKKYLFLKSLLIIYRLKIYFFINIIKNCSLFIISGSGSYVKINLPFDQDSHFLCIG